MEIQKTWRVQGSKDYCTLTQTGKGEVTLGGMTLTDHSELREFANKLTELAILMEREMPSTKCEATAQ